MGKSMCGYKTPETDSAVDIFTTQSGLNLGETTTDRKTERVCAELSCCESICWCLWFILATIILTVICFMSWKKDSDLIIAWPCLVVPYICVFFKLTPFSSYDDNTWQVILFLNFLWFNFGGVAVILWTTEFVTRLFSLFLPSLILVLFMPCQTIVSTFVMLCRKKKTTGQCKPTK